MAHLSLGNNFISARHLAFAFSLFPAFVLVALVCLLGLPAFPVPGALGFPRCLILARVLPLPVAHVPGALGVFSCPTLARVLPSSCPSLPSCDFFHFRISISVGRIGAVALLLVSLGASTPILWQIGLVGVRVGEASHPRPAHPTPERAPNALNVPEVLVQVPGSGPGLPAVHSGAPVPGSSSAQAPHAYVVPPPPLPVSPSRPSRFCTLPLPRDSSRHLSGSPAPHRRRSRSPVRPSSAHPLEQPVRPGQSRVFLPGRVMPGSRPPFLMGGFPSSRCDLISRHISRANSWATFPPSGSGAMVSARLRSVTASSVCDSMGAAPRAFTL